MKLIGGQGSGVSLDAEAFRTGVLKLQEENLAAVRTQMEEFLNAI